MFILWVFLLWGTLYAAALAYAIVVEGPVAWHRPLSGDDPIGGALNLLAAALAIVVWLAVGVGLAVNRRAR